MGLSKLKDLELRVQLEPKILSLSSGLSHYACEHEPRFVACCLAK